VSAHLERRDLLKAGVIAGGVVAGAAVLSSCAAGEEVESAVESAGATGQIPVSEIPVGGGVISQDPPVVLTQPTSGDIQAFTAICPHAGCLVSDVTDNEIFCPCHGSRFSAVDGAVISGPANSGLNGVAYQVTGDTVTFG
jgi:Rieske Fe-S protein